MKIKKIQKNSFAVSNVIAYIFSLSIASMVMLSSVLITDSIIDEKTSQIAGQQAQSLANKIGYGILQAMASVSTNPGVKITKTIDLPLDISKRSFYIDISENYVFVNTTDGLVSKKSSNYNANELDIGINSYKINSGSNILNISYKKPNYVYKFDFGKGDITSHSPVESGSYLVNENTVKNWAVGYEDYPYRIPIKICSTTSEDLENKVVKIALNKDNFNYDYADVEIYSYFVESNIVILDSNDFRMNYYIDHWNPNGESIILLNMTEDASTNEKVYLYYGDSTTSTHKILDILEFFDDFNDNDLSNWTVTGSQSPLGGTVIFSDGEYIISKGEWISDLTNPTGTASLITNEESYIVEAKVDILDGSEADLLFLSDDDPITDECYGTYVKKHDTIDKFFFRQYKFPAEDILKNIILPSTDQFIRIASKFYISKTEYPSTDQTDATYVNSYIYDSDGYEFLGNLSFFETDPPDSPHHYRKIGFGCGLVDTSNDITLDWIRLMKTPSNQTTVSFGPIEGDEDETYYWDQDVNAYIYGDSFNPFIPGPLLCDFHSHDEDRTFTIDSLDSGLYTITVTMGNYTGICGPMEVKIDGVTKLSFPSITNAGEFITKWFELDWEISDDLELEFTSTGEWAVNSIVIEKGEKGIKIMEN